MKKRRCAPRAAAHLVIALLVWLPALRPAAAVSPGPTEDREPPAVQAAAPLKIASYGQVLYSRPDGSPDSISVLRLRVSLESRVTRSLRFKTTVDAVKTPILLDACFNLDLFEGSRVLLGQFKIPFSRESLLSSSDRDTILRPPSVLALSPGRDIGASGRDIGILFQYRAGGLEASAGVFNGAGINRADNNRQKDLAGRLVFSSLERLKLGVSLYRGFHSAAVGQEPLRRNRAGLEIEAAVSVVDVKGEWILAWDGDLSRSGGYAQAAAALVPEKIQIIARYDLLENPGSPPAGRRDTWTLGLNGFFAPKTKAQLNLEWNKDRASGAAGTLSVLALFQAGF